MTDGGVWGSAGGSAGGSATRQRSAPRPSRAVLLAAVLVIAVCGALTSVVGLPWVVFSPGPVVNTLGTVGGRPVVAVSGARTYPTSSTLDLTTVDTTLPTTTVDIWQSLGAWFSPHQDLEPHGLIYPGTLTNQQSTQQGQQQMAGAQSSAVIAAARQLKLPLLAQIASITDGSPADGQLKPGDVLLAVDGRAAGSADAVVGLVRALRPGDRVVLRIRRGGVESTVAVVTGHGPGGDSGVPATSPYLGVGLQDTAPSVTVQVNLGEQIGGPSAGTMFALAIVDRLTPGSLAGSAHVAGTGTIDNFGTVGVIGGIRQKIAGARAGGATYFLAPAGNCPQAVTADVAGIRVVKITTLAGAVAALTAIADGRQAALPSCAP